MNHNTEKFKVAGVILLEKYKFPHERAVILLSKIQHVWI